MNNYRNKNFNNNKVQTKAEVSAMDINLENFSDKAEKVMDSYIGKFDITSSQIRPFLTMINHIVERATGGSKELNPSDIGELQYLKTRFVYSAGKETKTKRFIDKADILAFIDRIMDSKDKEDLKLFGRYFEALVAFHRFKGGDEK